MKLQPVNTFDDLILETTPELIVKERVNMDKAKAKLYRVRGNLETRKHERQRSQAGFDPAAENEKQMKQELIDTLQKADNNYVDCAERVRNYINNEIEFGEDAHERIEHAKELIKYVANNPCKTT